MKLNILTNNIPVSIACKNIIDKWPVRTLISVSPLKGFCRIYVILIFEYITRSICITSYWVLITVLREPSV